MLERGQADEVCCGLPTSVLFLQHLLEDILAHILVVILLSRHPPLRFLYFHHGNFVHWLTLWAALVLICLSTLSLSTRCSYAACIRARTWGRCGDLLCSTVKDHAEVADLNGCGDGNVFARVPSFSVCFQTC